MDEFHRARQHFASAAAAKLGTPASDVQVLPDDPTKSYSFATTMRTGRLLAFEARAGSKRQRGLVTPEGEVVFVDAGLHVLAREALFSDLAKELTAEQLADRIAWLYGGAYQLVRAVTDFGVLKKPTETPEPRFTDQRSGSTTLTFYMLHIPMHSSGVVTPYEVTVKLTSTSAVLAKTDRTATSDESP